jgi:hypothetical protein
MHTETILYQEVTLIAEDYFGPAAPRFIDRLIINHIGKKPEKLKPGDMPELIEWTRLTASMLTEDKNTVEELAERLEQLVP